MTSNQWKKKIKSFVGKATSLNEYFILSMLSGDYYLWVNDSEYICIDAPATEESTRTIINLLHEMHYKVMISHPGAF